MSLSTSIHGEYTTTGGGNCLPQRKFMAYYRRFIHPLVPLVGLGLTRYPDITTRGTCTMTMLDRMRRHRNWLKWSLALVCLAFVIFYIPDFLTNPNADLAATGTVAVVEGHEIQGEEFRRTYQAQLQAYRSAYGGQMPESLLKQLGVDQQILQQLLDERAAMVEAERRDIRVSDEEVRQRIFAVPSFQENGVFIGAERYQQLLASQNPPLSTTEFEDGVRRGLLVEKLRAAVTEWLSIPDKDVEEEYRRRNDKVKLAVVSFPTDSFRTNVTASDQEVATYFDGHTDDFRIPEKRKVKYVLVDVDAMQAKAVVPPADVERAYNDNFDQYSTPDQVRASHILLRTEGKDEAAVRAQAEEILKQAKAGADFAGLAKKYSEDEGTAPNGGDLDFFGRGRMVPEFDEAAFTLPQGQISDLVKTQFGFHIIKVTEKKSGVTRTLDEVRPQLLQQLAMERAQSEAADLAEKLDTELNTPADLETIGKANGLEVQETGFFAREEPIMGLGASPEVSARAFLMNPGEVSDAVRTARGYVFETLVAKTDSYVPKLDEVKEKVRDEVIKQKARELGRQKAAQAAAALKNAADFERGAKAAGYAAETTELITRDSPLPQIGIAADVTDQAFKLPQGAVSDPITTEQGTVIVKVLEKQEVTPTEISANKDRFREELLTDRRNRFYAAYMEKAKEKMRIQINRAVFQRVVG
jgi:peptidyl-prolyl cis-trans isomerase D